MSFLSISLAEAIWIENVCQKWHIQDYLFYNLLLLIFLLKYDESGVWK